MVEPTRNIPPIILSQRGACTHKAVPADWFFPSAAIASHASRRACGDDHPEAAKYDAIAAKAKAVCNTCAVLEVCGQWASRHSWQALDGVWGGLSEYDRHRIELRTRAERRARTRRRNERKDREKERKRQAKAAFEESLKNR